MLVGGLCSYFDRRSVSTWRFECRFSMTRGSGSFAGLLDGLLADTPDTTAAPTTETPTNPGDTLAPTAAPTASPTKPDSSGASYCSAST